MHRPRRAAPVSIWVLHGTREMFDAEIDLDIRHALGGGRWKRRCGVCGGCDHGERMFSTDDRKPPIPVSVSHAGTIHVAATGWGRLALGIDVVKLDSAGGRTTAGQTHRWLQPWITDRSLSTLATLPHPAGSAAALTLWAAREAAAKRRGTGLLEHAQDIPLLAGGTYESNRAKAIRPSGQRDWWARWTVPGHACVLTGSRRFYVDARNQP